MLLRRPRSVFKCSISRPKRTNSTAARSLVQLPDDSVGTFRECAFLPAVPSLLPKGSFKHLPAKKSWFEVDLNDRDKWRLKRSYLSPFGKTVVPLELTQGQRTTSATTETVFERFEAPLDYFIDWCERQSHEASKEDQIDVGAVRLYLAQASVSDLPAALREDLPTPSIVQSVGRGDVYDSNIWIGMSPTYTPLHKDPNPNLFVQLAGRKTVRVCEPSVGLEMFQAAQMRVSGRASAAFRGPEMMQGGEKEALEEMVWGKDVKDQLEAQLEPGDAIFIPRGWWHSIKGVGKGLTASVGTCEASPYQTRAHFLS